MQPTSSSSFLQVLENTDRLQGTDFLHNGIVGCGGAPSIYSPGASDSDEDMGSEGEAERFPGEGGDCSVVKAKVGEKRRSSVDRSMRSVEAVAVPAREGSLCESY